MKPVNPADRRVVNIKSGEFKPFVYEDGAAFGEVGRRAFARTEESALLGAVTRSRTSPAVA